MKQRRGRLRPLTLRRVEMCELSVTIEWQKEGRIMRIFKGRTTDGKVVEEVFDEKKMTLKISVTDKNGDRKVAERNPFGWESSSELSEDDIKNLQVIPDKDCAVNPVLVQALKLKKSMTKHAPAGTYWINPEREYSDEELGMIPVLPERYQPTERAEEIAKIVSSSRQFDEPISVIHLKGPAGSGKTEMCKEIAEKLHLPLSVPMTADPNWSETQLLVRYLPNTEKKNADEPDFVFQESPFVTAFRNGYCIEMQEMNVIKDAGVLARLNSALDNDPDNAVLVMPNGEKIRRHPDFVCIFTMNTGYAGCRKFQQSVISRALPFTIPTPGREQLIERVKAQTGFEDMESLKKMSTIISDIQKYLNAEDLGDGICGARELIGWVKLAIIHAGKKKGIEDSIILKSMFPSVLEKATQSTDEDYIGQMLSQVVAKYYPEEDVLQARADYESV